MIIHSSTAMIVGIQDEEYFTIEDGGPTVGAFVLVCVVPYTVVVQPFEFSVYTLGQTAQGKHQ